MAIVLPVTGSLNWDVTLDAALNSLQTQVNALGGGGPPSGAAGGDLSATYPNPTVARINGTSVPSTPSAGQVIVATSGSAATWQTPPASPPNGAAGGDLSSTYPNPTVAKVNGTSVPATPTAGQVIVATSGTAATWQSPPSSPPNGSASGDLSGSYPGPTVAKVNGTTVPATPTAGQALIATSGTASTWQSPSNDLGGTFSAPTVVSTHLSAPLPVLQGGTGSTTQNFVDLTTTQASIGGVKTFTAATNFFSAALTGATAGTSELTSKVTGDANNRFNMTADGGHNWGPGTAVTDTNLYRGGVGMVQTDFQFEVNAALSTSTAYGVQVAGDTFDRHRVTADGNTTIGPGNASRDVTFGRTAANQLGLTTTDLAIVSAGRGLKIAEGSNAKMGVATLSGGTVTVATTAVNANSRIFLTAQSSGAAPGALRVSTITAGTSFVITSSSGTDTSIAAWLIVDHT